MDCNCALQEVPPGVWRPFRVGPATREAARDVKRCGKRLFEVKEGCWIYRPGIVPHSKATSAASNFLKEASLSKIIRCAIDLHRGPWYCQDMAMTNYILFDL